MNITSFTNGFDLIEHIESGGSFDVILLDIVMSGYTGIQTAKELRTKHYSNRIVFLTSSPEFAIDSYSVKAYHYSLKPIQKEELFDLINQISREVHVENSQSILVKAECGLYKVCIYQLEYCEFFNRIITWHLSDGTVFRSSGSMRHLEQYMKDFHCMIKPHRSFMINMDYISKMTGSGIEMECGTLIPIPRIKYNEILTLYKNYFFSNQQNEQIE